MQINVTLDAEVLLNPEEALGHILISDDDGGEISGQDVWVDDWLMALVEGVQALSRGEQEFASEIMSEPHPLIFKSYGRGLSISFAGKSVVGDDLHVFGRELKAEIRRVMSEFGEGAEFRPDSFWVELRQYARA